MRLASVMVVPLLLTVAGLAGIDAEGCEGGDTSPTPPPASRLLVGAATVTILPEVNGSTSYFDPLRSAPPLAMPPGDPGRDPGIFVEQWDVGTLGIGNGESSSHWVHDELRAGAVAFRDLDHPENKTLVLVTADVYMLFRNDLEGIYDKVRQAVGPAVYEDLTILVTATHNHMGPDTAGMEGMNHAYFEYLTDQIRDLILEAIDESRLRPAHLKVAETRYQFGAADDHAPHIVDPSLNVLQAVSAEDPTQVIATLVQWNNHPEDTLGFGKTVYATEEQATYLRSIDECISEDGGATCHIEGQYLSAGFSGYAMRAVMEATGAPALYFNGPIGGLTAPLHAAVWETEGENGRPAGDGFVIPDGAALITERNFHRLAVTGAELGRRVLAELAGGELITTIPVSFRSVQLYSRLSNFAFRVGMVVRKTGEPLLLGHTRRELFNCPAAGPKNDATCISDNYESASDPYLLIPARVGDHGKTELWYVQLGPVGLLTLPAEGTPEIAEGLPTDFVSDPRGVYFRTDADRFNHVPAAAYATGGYVKQLMPTPYKWILGLTQDELGYAVPASDWRVFCMADEADFGGAEGNCAALYASGVMNYVDYDGQKWSISGERCALMLTDPTVLSQPPYTQHPEGAHWAQVSCTYGQMWDKPDGHYEETMSASWDLAGDIQAAAKALFAWEGPLEEVNPAFIGYNPVP